MAQLSKLLLYFSLLKLKTKELNALRLSKFLSNLRKKLEWIQKSQNLLKIQKNKLNTIKNSE